MTGIGAEAGMTPSLEDNTCLLISSQDPHGQVCRQHTCAQSWQDEMKLQRDHNVVLVARAATIHLRMYLHWCLYLS